MCQWEVQTYWRNEPFDVLLLLWVFWGVARRTPVGGHELEGVEHVASVGPLVSDWKKKDVTCRGGVTWLQRTREIRGFIFLPSPLSPIYHE